MTDQPLASITAAQSIAIGTLAEANGISIENADEVTFEYEGTYSLTFSAQITNYANSVQKAVFWVKKNGVDYPDSATEMDLQPRKSSGIPNRQVITINYVATAEAGDYVQVYWAGDSTDLKVESLPAGTSPVYPAVPSIILTAVQVMYTQVGPEGPQGPAGEGSSVTVSETAPTGASEGDQWYNSTASETYIYYDGYWVEMNNSLPGPKGDTGAQGPEGPMGPAGAQGPEGPADAALPAGSIVQWASNIIPNNWLLCDGSAVSRSAWPSLFAAIGTSYGAGNGTTTFNLPDLKGRVAVGRDSTQTEFDILGETGGAKTHTLTEAQMPSHTHTQNSHNHTQNQHEHPIQNTTSSPNGDFIGMTGGTQGGWGMAQGANNQIYRLTPNPATATNNAATATNQNTGGGQAHNNLQPYQVFNYIIKASAGTTEGDSELATRVGAVELGKANLIGGNTFTGNQTTDTSFISNGTTLSSRFSASSSLSGADDYLYLLNGANNTGNKATHFVNSSNRTTDGGANSYTIRNDGGPLNLGSSSFTTTIFGRTLNPNQPSFRAFVNTSVSYGTTWQKIQITNEIHDNAGNYDAANSRFTAPVAGVYLFTASVVNNPHEGDGTLAVAINGNPNNYISTSMTGSGLFQGPSVSAAVKLAANDYVEVWRYFSSSVTTRGPQWSGYFSGHLLG
jgi:microcystin-dependent protein